METNWITIEDKSSHLKNLTNYLQEENSVANSVDLMLSEFALSSEDQKEEFKILLIDWFNSIDRQNLDQMLLETKVRDFIYEMF